MAYSLDYSCTEGGPFTSRTILPSVISLGLSQSPVVATDSALKTPSLTLAPLISLLTFLALEGHT